SLPRTFSGARRARILCFSSYLSQQICFSCEYVSFRLRSYKCPIFCENCAPCEKHGIGRPKRLSKTRESKPNRLTNTASCAEIFETSSCRATIRYICSTYCIEITSHQSMPWWSSRKLNPAPNEFRTG